MGREHYSRVGYGFTEHEARQNAIAEATAENGNQEGYSGDINCDTGEDSQSKCLEKPVQAKTCIVDKTVQKGARKWETVFVISPIWGFSGHYNPRKHAEVKTTQGDAIKKAKAMAIEFGEEFGIEIEKRLIGSKSRIATVKPKKSKKGKWLFTGMARS